MDTDRIVPLDQLEDFEVAEGDPDVRGWRVVAADGRKIGQVDNLLIDTAVMKVRYLDVEVDDDLIAGDPDRHILIPIGYARLDEDSDQICVDELDSRTLEQIPSYIREPVTGEYESSLKTYYDRNLIRTANPVSTGTTPPADVSGLYPRDPLIEERFDDLNRRDSGVV
jgi:photosynthetic reaction center H subunit